MIESRHGKNSPQYLRQINDFDEVITMIFSLQEAKEEPIVIWVFTKEIKSVNPTKVTKSQPIILSIIP